MLDVFRLRWLLTAGLLLVIVSAAAGWATRSSAPRDIVYETVPGVLELPTGVPLWDESGRHVDLVARTETRPGWDAVRLPVLLPGNYYVVTPSATLAGWHAPEVAQITLVADTTEDRDAPVLGQPAWWWLLTACLGAAGAVIARRRIIAAACSVVSVTGVVAWVVTAGAVTAPAVFAGALGVAGVAVYSVAARRLESSRRVLAAFAVVVTLTGVLAPVGALGSGVILVGALGMAAAVLLPMTVSAAALAALCGVVGFFVWTGLQPAEHAYVAPPDPRRCLLASEMGGRPDGAFIDCWRAYGAALGASGTLAQANEVLADTIEELSRVGQFGPGCRIAGDALAASVTLRFDLEQIATDLSSACDFNGPHGMAIGAMTYTPVDQMGDLAVRMCALPTPLDPTSFASQCWHGVGQAVARRTGFDTKSVADVCLLAPTPGAMGNCAEGMYMEVSDDLQRLRRNAALRHLPAGFSMEKTCLGMPIELTLGCFRYLGEEFMNSDPHSTDRDQPADRIAMRAGDVCSAISEDKRASYCWLGVGSLVFDYAGKELDQLELMQRLDRVCSRADAANDRDMCVMRGGMDFIAASLGKGTFSPEATQQFCSMLTGPEAATHCSNTERFVNAMKGRGVLRDE